MPLDLDKITTIIKDIRNNTDKNKLIDNYIDKAIHAINFTFTEKESLPIYDTLEITIKNL
jgi:hypothetical protein